MPFSLYKKKQGLVIRWGFLAVTIILALFAAYRCYIGFPYSNLTTDEPRSAFWESFYQVLVKFTIPLIELEIAITYRLIIAISIGIVLLVFLTYLTFKNERISEFLIDTDSEMRKVAWPSYGEVADSSLVVIIVIIAMGVYLYSADILLNKFFQWLLF